jgi:signal transduction histidine kinase
MIGDLGALVLAELPFGVAAFGNDGRLAYANDAFVRLTGIDARRANGIDEAAFSVLLASHCTSGCYFEGIAALRRHQRHNPGGRATTVIEMVAGATLEVEYVTGRSGELAFQVILRNVTAAIERNARLAHALDKAAHEIRTPMANVFGYSELLMRGGLDTTALAEMHSVVFRNADQMRVLVTDIFEYARIAAEPDARARHCPVNMKTLLTGSITCHRPPAGREPPTIEMEQTELLASGDPLQLDQAIHQVIANAYRFSCFESTVTVRLYRKALADGGGEIVLAVRDHGISMDQTTRLRAGEPFFRADTSGHIPGNGLGLSIAAAVMAAHRGRLVINSEPGAGSEVSLVLPAFESRVAIS